MTDSSQVEALTGRSELQPRKSSKFQSDNIKIFVGPTKTFFNAHKDILVKIPYFEKCLAGSFQEATTREIILPDDDPDSFEQILEFAYFGKVSIKIIAGEGLTEMEEARIEILTLIGTYLLADKFCLESLVNQLIDLYLRASKFRGSSFTKIFLLEKMGPPDSKLKNLMLNIMARKMRRHGVPDCRRRCPSFFTHFIDTSAENGDLMMTALTES